MLFDTQRPEWQALFNPVNNLVYNADGRSVHTVIVDGRVVVDAYRQSFVDEPQALRQGAGDRREAPGPDGHDLPAVEVADRLAPGPAYRARFIDVQRSLPLLSEPMAEPFAPARKWTRLGTTGWSRRSSSGRKTVSSFSAAT